LRDGFDRGGGGKLPRKWKRAKINTKNEEDERREVNFNSKRVWEKEGEESVTVERE